MFELEKSKRLEFTNVYNAIRDAWQEQFSDEPAFAIVSGAQTDEGVTSSSYAERIKNTYNQFCNNLLCQNPEMVVADAGSAIIISVA